LQKASLLQLPLRGVSVSFFPCFWHLGSAANGSLLATVFDR
jgi:hypothetical protein